MLSRPELRESYGRRSRELSQGYDLDSQAAKMEAAYRQAMLTHAKGRTVLLEGESERNRFEEMLRFFKPTTARKT